MMPDCIVCFDECEDGPAVAVCAAPAGHSLCSDCCSGYIRAACSPEQRAQLKAAEGKLACPSPGCGAAWAGPYRLAQCVDEDTFELFERARCDIAAATASAEERARLEARAARSEHKACGSDGGGEEAARIAVLAERVREEILTLCCPECGTAFIDFEGCAALKCPGCGCGFCAYCLQACRKDAHAHVGRCPYGKGTYVAQAVFDELQRERKLREVGKLLDAQRSDDTRARVLSAVRRDCKVRARVPYALRGRGPTT